MAGLPRCGCTWAPTRTRLSPSSPEPSPVPGVDAGDAPAAKPAVRDTCGIATALENARAAFNEQHWQAARTLFEAAASEGALSDGDLDKRASAAYLSGHDQEAFDLWSAGFRAREAADDAPSAVRFAARMAQGLGFKGDLVRCAGWVGRAARLLEAADVDCVEQGYIEYGRAMLRILEAGDVVGAHASFVATGRIGERFGNRELQTMARVGEGRTLIYQGEVDAGLALLDEAMVAVEERAIPAIAIGDAYCTVIDACRELFDLNRLRTWTGSLSHWCDGQPDLVLYRGHCLLHRAEVLLFDGEWDAALVEARAACARLADPIHPMTLGGAHLVEGDLLRLRAAYEDAERAYRRASDYGCQPQPGLSLLRLAEGRAEAALSGITRALEEAQDPVSRARLLPAAVDIQIAVGSADQAEECAAELTTVAALFGSRLLEGFALMAEGLVLLAGDRGGAALRSLRAAQGVWSEIHVPYEAARTRSLISAACRALNDFDGAELEEATARDAFAKLGAPVWPAPPGDPVRDPPDGLTTRELEVLRVLAQGRTNRAIAAELFISEKTVATHIGHIYAKIGVTNRAAATAYAYDRGLL